MRGMSASSGRELTPWQKSVMIVGWLIHVYLVCSFIHRRFFIYHFDDMISYIVLVYKDERTK